MTWKIFAFFLLSLSFFTSTCHAMTEAEFRGALRKALGAQGLSQTQKAKHILNRMGFGGNPKTSQRLERLKTDEEIIKFVVNQLAAVNNSAPANSPANQVFAMSFHMDPPGNCKTAKTYNNEALAFKYCNSYRKNTEGKVDNDQDYTPRPGLMDFKSVDINTNFSAMAVELAATFNQANQQLLLARNKKESASKIQELETKKLVAMTNLGNFSGNMWAALRNRQVARALLDDNRAFRYQLADFWFNHFNVSIEKVGGNNLYPYFPVIEDHMMGSFLELLTATAKSPAMLFYLDNFISGRNKIKIMKDARRLAAIQCHPRFRRGVQACAERVVRQALSNNIVINENYAREVIELHTIGQGPGKYYSQETVQQAANVLSGWSVRNGKFYFDPSYHVDGDKDLTISNSGIAISNGGEYEGIVLLRFLAEHEATAENISRKLVRRFVSEDSTFTEPLVETLKTEFLRTQGNLPHLYQVLLSSTQFWSPEAYRSKAVRPFDKHVRMARALGIKVDMNKTYQRDRILQIAREITTRSQRDGQSLFACVPPTGFPDSNNHWENVGSVLSTALNGFRAEELAINHRDYETFYTNLTPRMSLDDPRIPLTYMKLFYFFQDSTAILSNSNPTEMTEAQRFSILNSLNNNFDFELLTGNRATSDILYTDPKNSVTPLSQVPNDQMDSRYLFYYLPGAVKPLKRDYYLLPVRTQLTLHFGSQEASRY